MYTYDKFILTVRIIQIKFLQMLVIFIYFSCNNDLQISVSRIDMDFVPNIWIFMLLVYQTFRVSSQFSIQMLYQMKKRWFIKIFYVWIWMGSKPDQFSLQCSTE